MEIQTKKILFVTIILLALIFSLAFKIQNLDRKLNDTLKVLELQSELNKKLALGFSELVNNETLLINKVDSLKRLKNE